MNEFNVKIVYQQVIAMYDSTVVKSAVTGPDLSQVLISQHTEVPCRR